MRAWLLHLIRERVLELALAFALGYAALTVADSVAGVGTSVLAQHIGRDPSGSGDTGTVLDLLSGSFALNFTVGGTIIVYGELLSAAVSLGILALGAVIVIRRRDRELGECPFCGSRVPYESTHCAYCGSAVTPGEP